MRFCYRPGSDDIAAFNAGGFSNPIKVGNYTDPSGSGAYMGTTLAARGGRTLLATYNQTTPGIGSFSVSGSTLTPKGPYNTVACTAGIDITKDSKYAFVGEFATYTQVEVFPINSDSSLGSSAAYSFPQGGFNSNNVALSPDETRLYIDNNNSFQITTLAFSEQALAGKQLQFFCVSNPLKAPPFGFLEYTFGLTTAATTGKGGYLYVVEVSYNSLFVIQSAVALL